MSPKRKRTSLQREAKREGVTKAQMSAGRAKQPERSYPEADGGSLPRETDRGSIRATNLCLAKALGRRELCSALET